MSASKVASKTGTVSPSARSRRSSSASTATTSARDGGVGRRALAGGGGAAGGGGYGADVGRAATDHAAAR